MVYNYYMKKFLFSVLISSLSLCAVAQMTVVRVDGKKVFLDTSEEKTVPAKGSTFKVILSSQPLINPKTGKNLGDIYTYSETGTLVEIQPLYAVGELKNTTGVNIGQAAVFEEIKTAVPAQIEEKQPQKSTRKTTVYNPVEQTVISLSQADVTAPGAKNIITLSDKNQITVFSRADNENLKQEMSFTLPVGQKGISVSSAPVKAGLAQIFVSAYNSTTGKISTFVLENQNSALKQTSSLPYFVKELGCGKDKKIWAQRAFILGNSPGDAREVVYEKNKFIASGSTFSTHHNWLEGLNYFPVEKENANNLILTANDGTLRMMLANGKRAESKDNFGSTPLRLQHKQEILKFYPSVQAFGMPGHATLAAVENDAKFGLLSKTFGQYKNGKIHFLDYQKGRLHITDTVELDGTLYDTACTDTVILTAEALPDGTSSIVEILK